MAFRSKKRGVLPGFGPTLGYTVFYLSFMVLIPLSALVFRTAGMTWGSFMATVTSPRVMASYRVTFGSAFIAAVINAVFGAVTAWVLVRYRFPGKRIVDAMVDSPSRCLRPSSASPWRRSTLRTGGSGLSLSREALRSPTPPPALLWL